MIINDFIVNLMSQHVVPFWVALLILFIVVVELIYNKLIRESTRKSGWIKFTIDNKLKAFAISIVTFVGIYVSGLIIELICYIIIPILITIGIVGIVVLFFYSNYLLAKKYGNKYEFKKGQKLRVVDLNGLVRSALVKTPKDSIVTCVGKIPCKSAYKVKTSSGKIAERKEWRFQSIE